MITPDQDARADDFIYESERNATPANDEGRVPKLEENGKLSPLFLSTLDTFTYNEDGEIATAKDTSRTPDVTYTFAYLGDFLSTITDGTNTWTLTWSDDKLVSIIKT